MDVAGNARALDCRAGHQSPKTAAPTSPDLVSRASIGVATWMALNAKSIYRPRIFFFRGIAEFRAVFGGLVDYAISSAWTIRGALLLGVPIPFVSDSSQSSRWLLRLTVCHRSSWSVAR